jgi:hypothetical protein
MVQLTLRNEGNRSLRNVDNYLRARLYIPGDRNSHANETSGCNSRQRYELLISREGLLYKINTHHTVCPNMSSKCLSEVMFNSLQFHIYKYCGVHLR